MNDSDTRESWMKAALERFPPRTLAYARMDTGSIADLVPAGNHMMVDVENLGANTAAPIITSVGAAIFNERGDIKAKFHAHISIDSSVLAGCTPTQNTLMWWLSEASQEARDALVRGQRGAEQLDHVLRVFAEFFASNDAQTIWANGAADDLTWLRSAYDAAKIPVPWEYDQARCYRTIRKMLNPSRTLDVKPELEHDALADAVAQAKTLIAMVRRPCVMRLVDVE